MDCILKKKRWFGRGAQVRKTSLLEVEFITAQALTFGVFIFSGPGIWPKPSIFGRRSIFFYNAKQRERDDTCTPPGSGSVLCHRNACRPRSRQTFLKLKFEPVSFLFLFYFWSPFTSNGSIIRVIFASKSEKIILRALMYSDEISRYNHTSRTFSILSLFASWN